MARVYGIEKRLAKYPIDEALAKEIMGSGDLIRITTRMEERLGPETTCRILDSCACGTSQKELTRIKAIDAETLEEKIAKIAFLGDFHSDWIVTLNPDRTITAGWRIGDTEAYSCVCTSAVDRNTKVCELTRDGRTMPLAYCFCCAGHCRQHLEKLLGIRLKTKEIVSSPINSKGQKPCAFLLEII